MPSTVTARAVGPPGPREVSMHAQPSTVHLNGLAAQLWHAGKKVLESTLIPLGLFYLLLNLTGLTGGLLAALGWGVAAVVCRMVLRVPVPAVLWLTTGLLVVRTIIGVTTGSVFFYFLQPGLQNFLIAFVLLATLPFERTLLGRLADDFCAFPVALTGNARVQRFFRRASVLWALVFVTNGAATLWALARTTLEEFLLVTTAGSYALVGVAAAVSLLWFRGELRGAGIRLRLRPTSRAT